MSWVLRSVGGEDRCGSSVSLQESPRMGMWGKRVRGVHHLLAFSGACLSQLPRHMWNGTKGQRGWDVG